MSSTAGVAGDAKEVLVGVGTTGKTETVGVGSEVATVLVGVRTGVSALTVGVEVGVAVLTVGVGTAVVALAVGEAGVPVGIRDIQPVVAVAVGADNTLVKVGVTAPVASLVGKTRLSEVPVSVRTDTAVGSVTWVAVGGIVDVGVAVSDVAVGEGVKACRRGGRGMFTLTLQELMERITSRATIGNHGALQVCLTIMGMPPLSLRCKPIDAYLCISYHLMEIYAR
jgi:hypothetical protein